MWTESFPVWRAGLAMVIAGLFIAGAWALASDAPGTTFLALARFAVLPLILPIIDTAIRFFADMARWAWERGYWRSRPFLDEPTPPQPAVLDLLPPPDPLGGIAYKIMGKAQPDLPRIAPADLRETQWRRACIGFLQAGHAIGNRWGFRDMKAGGVVERADWDLIVDVLKQAGLVTAIPGEGTHPYPDYSTALARLRAGCPLPCPDGPIPSVARQHSTTQHSTAYTAGTAEGQG